MRIKKIYVAEDIPIGKPKVEKENLDDTISNTDVIVHLDEGGSYKANFITLKKLISEFQEHNDSAKEPGQKYLWSKGMVIVDKIEKEELLPMIAFMIEEGDFQMIFEKL